MKRVKIREGNVGLISKNGKFLAFVKAGSHWIKSSNNIQSFDLEGLFHLSKEYRIFMENELFNDAINSFRIADNELALIYEDGIFSNLLNSGNYFLWKENTRTTFKMVDLGKMEIDESIDASILSKPEMLKYFRVFKVESFENAALFVDGNFEKFLSGGTYKFWQNDRSIEMLKADTRLQSMEVLGQEILTKDKAALRINFNAKYQIENFEKALIENKDFKGQLYILIQMALRDYVGALSLDELMENKNKISDYIIHSISEQAKGLGVKILESGIKDVILPGDMKEILNRVLIAQKQAQANVIGRREENAATRSLINTAKLMEESPMLFKLKEMEYVERIAERIGEISLSGNGKMMEQLKEIFTK